MQHPGLGLRIQPKAETKLSRCRRVTWGLNLQLFTPTSQLAFNKAILSIQLSRNGLLGSLIAEYLIGETHSRGVSVNHLLNADNHTPQASRISVYEAINSPWLTLPEWTFHLSSQAHPLFTAAGWVSHRPWNPRWTSLWASHQHRPPPTCTGSLLAIWGVWRARSMLFCILGTRLDTCYIAG